MIFDTRLPCQFTQSVFISFGNLPLSMSPSESMTLPPRHIPMKKKKHEPMKIKKKTHAKNKISDDIITGKKMNWLHQFNQFKVFTGTFFSNTLHLDRIVHVLRRQLTSTSRGSQSRVSFSITIYFWKNRMWWCCGFTSIEMISFFLSNFISFSSDCVERRPADKNNVTQLLDTTITSNIIFLRSFKSIHRD